MGAVTLGQNSCHVRTPESAEWFSQADNLSKIDQICGLPSPPDRTKGQNLVVVKPVFLDAPQF